MVEVVAGTRHACAVRRDGAVACWGANESGQLGIGSRDDFGDEPDELQPPLVWPPTER